MNTSVQEHLHINNFFETYAASLENHDTKLMANHYFIPCTFISDDSNTTFSDASKLEGLFNQGVIFYKQFGIVHALPEIWNKQFITNRIARVKVKWSYLDKDKQLVYDCEYQYILKLDKHSHWKIILSISVNEKEQMEAWQKNKKTA